MPPDDPTTRSDAQDGLSATIPPSSAPEEGVSEGPAEAVLGPQDAISTSGDGAAAPIGGSEAPGDGVAAPGGVPPEVLAAQNRLAVAARAAKYASAALKVVGKVEETVELAWPEPVAAWIEALEDGLEPEPDAIKRALRDLSTLLPAICRGEEISDENLVAFDVGERRPLTTTVYDDSAEADVDQPAVELDVREEKEGKLVWLKRDGTPAGAEVQGFVDALADVQDGGVPLDEGAVLRELADELSKSRSSLHRTAVGVLYDVADRLDEPSLELRIVAYERLFVLLGQAILDKVPGQLKNEPKEIVEATINVIRRLSTAPHNSSRTSEEKERERRRGLLARMAGNIAGGFMVNPPAELRDAREVAEVSVNVAQEILAVIEKESDDG